MAGQTELIGDLLVRRAFGDQLGCALCDPTV
jgi:hypothetical protein